MPKYLIKFLSLFIPIKSVRKSFRQKMNKLNAFGDLATVFTEIKTKRDTVVDHKSLCKVIILGSSHGAYGINPEFVGEDCFNLCSNSQDLYTSKRILTYMQKELPNLQKVVICLDVFSKGWNLSRTSAEHICASYQYLYGIDYPLFVDHHNNLKRCKKLDKLDLKVKENKNGYLNPPRLILTNSAEERVKSHLREHNREQTQYCHLTDMIQLCVSKNIDVYILIAPVRKDYQVLIPQNLLLTEAQKLADEKAKVVDFFNDSDFINEDFYDFDHLNPIGCKKLSIKLKGYIR